MMIKFELEVWCGNTEPAHYVSHYRGEVFGYDDADEDEEELDEPDVRLGTIDVLYVNRNRILNENESLFEAMDDFSSETMECYEAIIDQETNDWKDEVQVLIGEGGMVNYDILIINRLELEEKFRGKSIGEQVARQVINTLGSNCGVIVCKPFPLQYRGYGAPEHAKDRAAPGYERKRRDAFSKVANFWTKVGFQKLPSSDHYIWVER